MLKIGPFRLEKWTYTLEKAIYTLEKASRTLEKRSDGLEKAIYTLGKSSRTLGKRADALEKWADALEKWADTLEKWADTLEKRRGVPEKRSDALGKRIYTLEKPARALGKRSFGRVTGAGGVGSRISPLTNATGSLTCAPPSPMALFDFRKTSPPPLASVPVPASAAAEVAGRATVTPMEDLLRLVIEEKASDLHISVGAPPVVRLRGELVKLELRPLTPEDTETLARAITSEANMQRVNEDGSVDFGFTFRGDNRFRVSVYRQKGCIGIALRLVPRSLLTLDEIGFPPSVTELLYIPRGLVLVTGPTGSGKSTTLASMLNVINETTSSHIITIEDPIEYFHEHKRGIINQREIGVDVPTFAEGLRRALRQDPDVILVGEMRDLETMETAITAAETGHLVFATLHTTGAARTVDRVVDAFPSDKQEMIRTQLSTNLKAVISQLLIPRMDGKGRVAAFEIMINTPSIAALIRDNKTFRIPNDILTGSKYGMVSLETSLAELYLRGFISLDQVTSKAQDPQAALQIIGERQPRKK